MDSDLIHHGADGLVPRPELTDELLTDLRRQGVYQRGSTAASFPH
jgi:hypothetical protein